MKRFVFRLQVVLDRAREEEEERQRQLALVQHERFRKEEEIVHVKDARRDLMAEMARVQQVVFAANEMHDRHLQLEAMAVDLLRMREEAAEIDKRVVTAQQVLVEAMRKRQVLDKLREKQLEEYRQAEAREELRVMEETTLPRLARLRAEEAQRHVALMGRED